ncbi:hypothetical protein M5K25_007696 [Dendrobium thyrsiflorum]|uniref:Uncharacterized protein n=1 Tax=Dendrobium thyrsiflorum TaxID=117978 RepID=A0ABD0VLZ8_DENTH
MALMIPPNISAGTAIAAALLTLSFIFLIRLKSKQGKEKQLLPLPPGPPGLPILGSLPFLKPNLHQYFSGLAGTYGPVFSIRLGYKLCVVISSPSAAREILKYQDAAFANRVIPAAILFNYNGSRPDLLWSPYDTHWRIMRKIVVREMLSPTSLEAMAPTRRREIRRTVENLWARAKMGLTVHVREIASLTMLNMMTTMLWGERAAGDCDEKELQQAIKELINLFMEPNVADFFPIVAPLDPQGLGRRVKKLTEWIIKYLEKIVEKKKQKMAVGERRRDVLELLLDLVEIGNPQEPFTMDDLFKLIMGLMEASTDSISTVVEWSMAELLNDPKKMQIAQQELDHVIGKHRVVEESDIPQLHYLSAFVKETLRLHPPAPLLVPHCPSSQCVVGGFSVPAGTTVFVNMWKIQRDPHLWGEDAEEFKPERFLVTGKEMNDFYLRGNDQFCYLPFGAGRRMCVGIALGEKMVIYMLASLLHSFEWRLPENVTLELREKFGTVLIKAEELVVVPAARLDKPELYKPEQELEVRKEKQGKCFERMALTFRPEISAGTGVTALVTFYLTALFLFLLRLKRKKGSEKKQTLPLPPGPHGLPILGSLPFLNPNLHQYFADLARSYGPILSLRLGSKLCVVVSSPSAAREIFKDQDAAFANHATPAATLFYFRGSNLDLLWSAYGPHWRMLRKIAVHEMLGTASIEAVAPLRCRAMRRTVELVCARAKMGAAVDVRETTFLTVLNVMTSMLWGEQVAGSSDGKEFRRAIEGAVDILMAPNVLDFIPVLAPLDPQGLGRRTKKLMVWINKYLEEIVEKKKQKMDLIGGSADTISTAVEWSMAELLSNPEKMRTAQQELDAVVGKHRIVGESDIPQLHYLCAVVKESLRLHPPLPLLIPHCPSTHCVVGGFSVPAGTSVFVNVWVIHRDPHLWGEDAEEFKPERFLETSRQKKDFYLGGKDEFCYLPFGAGRRVCVGTAIGEKMVIYMLASLLHSFEWRLPKGASLELGEKFGAVLRKVEQLFAVPTMRLDTPELYL